MRVLTHQFYLLAPFFLGHSSIMSCLSYISNSLVLITFDGSSYLSIHYMDHFFCYDYSHINSIFKIYVLNRVVNVHDLESFFYLYESSLYLPSFLDEE